jgi:putative transposase
LPEHIHCIWTLPQDDHDFSTRWRLLKSFFSRHCEHKHHELKPSQIEKKEQAIWQRRFWEHYIRDEKDFINHVEYIHYNPVKHGLVKAPKDWKYSSLRNPEYTGHQFRFELDTDSGSDWTVNPILTGQQIRF